MREERRGGWENEIVEEGQEFGNGCGMVGEQFFFEKKEMWDRMKWMPNKPPTRQKAKSPRHSIYTCPTLTKTKPTLPSPTASPKQRSIQVYSKASLNTHLDRKKSEP